MSEQTIMRLKGVAERFAAAAFLAEAEVLAACSRAKAATDMADAALKELVSAGYKEATHGLLEIKWR